ncbi:hypothetical protein KIN20_013906 [Parelaphostrongylus tenuis]|uniref:Uncharacterized protein n=1 Tax=Parelaphostrongylus tenuis TaxID=148309 RepID=A0AAD5QP21_PARTN|nr:hypothetical protein KIN20_013906 [Parelaphostrongylus tenuis]
MNPRARYFKATSLTNDSVSVSSVEDDQQSEFGFTVEPAPRDVPSFGLFSFFTKKPSAYDRPKLSNPFISFPYTAPAEAKSRRHSDDRSGDILNLLRRSSGPNLMHLARVPSNFRNTLWKASLNPNLNM